MSPELAEQEVAKSNITGDDPKTEDTQQLENSVQMVSDRKSEALYRLTAYGGETDSDVFIQYLNPNLILLTDYILGQ